MSAVPLSLLEVSARERERERESFSFILFSFQISVMATCVLFILSSTTCLTLRRQQRKVVGTVVTEREGEGPHLVLPAPSLLDSNPHYQSRPGVARVYQRHQSLCLLPAPPLSLMDQLPVQVPLQLQLGRVQVSSTGLLSQQVVCLREKKKRVGNGVCPLSIEWRLICSHTILIRL